MKFQGIGFLLLSGILIFAASTVWNTVAAYGYLKITSPAKGQKVPPGNIVISGTSSSNATNHCTVSININGIKPNQNVIPTGQNGPNDYSKWRFTDASKYALIKEGFNKITAKYSCPQNMVTRFYSINVTGTKTLEALRSGGQQHQTLRNTTIINNPFPPLLPGH
jgi:hypothetical protein